MASASLDGIPHELKMMTIEYLEEAPDPAPPPRRHHAQRSPRIRQYHWMKLSMTSRLEILNIRSISPSWRDASWKSFGKVIGDLQFRMIPADMLDLVKMSTMPQLAPYITTLCFGTAGFECPKFAVIKDAKGNMSIVTFLKTMASLIEDKPTEFAFRSLIEQYEAACKRQYRFMRSVDVQNGYVEALKKLPRLRSIRVDSADWIGENKTHLKGWIGPYGRSLFARVWENVIPLLPPKSKPRPKETLVDANHVIYAHDRGRGTDVVMGLVEALELSGARIEQLVQVWGGSLGNVPFRCIPILKRFKNPENLIHIHTLHVQAACDLRTSDLDTLSALLLSSSTLKDVTVTIRGPPDRELRKNPYKARDLDPFITSLLTTPCSFERLTLLRAAFNVVEDELLDTLKKHMRTLRYVRLEYVKMTAGSWISLLNRLSAEAFGRLEYVGLYMVDQAEQIPWIWDRAYDRKSLQGLGFDVEWNDQFGAGVVEMPMLDLVHRKYRTMGEVAMDVDVQNAAGDVADLGV